MNRMLTNPSKLLPRMVVVLQKSPTVRFILHLRELTGGAFVARGQCIGRALVARRYRSIV
jgi:hypothetical protein